MDKLIHRAGLALSTSEAGRKIKEKAVSLDGETVTAPSVNLHVPCEVTLRVGKRMKRISLVT
jgi:ribosomal protein S4